MKATSASQPEQLLLNILAHHCVSYFISLKHFVLPVPTPNPALLNGIQEPAVTWGYPPGGELKILS